MRPSSRRSCTTAPLRPVVAGAGTGKTRTLVARRKAAPSSKRLPSGPSCSPSAVSVCRSRCWAWTQRLAGGPEAARVWEGLPRGRQLVAALLRAGARPASEFHHHGLLRRRRPHGSRPQRTGPGGDTLRFPQADPSTDRLGAVNSQTKLTEVVEKRFPWRREEISDVRSVFEVRLRSGTWPDSFSITTTCCSTGGLRMHIWAPRRQLLGLFDHILVDEYQDESCTGSHRCRHARGGDRSNGGRRRCAGDLLVSCRRLGQHAEFL